MVSRHSGRKKVYGMTGDSGDSGCVSWLAFPLEEWLMQLRRRVTLWPVCLYGDAVR